MTAHNQPSRHRRNRGWCAGCLGDGRCPVVVDGWAFCGEDCARHGVHWINRGLCGCTRRSVRWLAHEAES